MALGLTRIRQNPAIDAVSNASNISQQAVRADVPLAAAAAGEPQSLVERLRALGRAVNDPGISSNEREVYSRQIVALVDSVLDEVNANAPPAQPPTAPVVSPHSPYATTAAAPRTFTPHPGQHRPGAFGRRTPLPNPLQQFSTLFQAPQRPRGAQLSNIAQLNARLLLLEQYSAAEGNISTGQRLIDAHSARLSEISSIVEMLGDLVDQAAATEDAEVRTQIQTRIQHGMAQIDNIAQTAPRADAPAADSPRERIVRDDTAPAQSAPVRATDRFEFQVGINTSNVVEFELARLDAENLGLYDIDVRGASDAELLEIAERLDAAQEFLHAEQGRTRSLDWLMVGSQSVLEVNRRTVGADDIRHDLSYRRQADDNHERVMLTILIQRMAFEASTWQG